MTRSQHVYEIRPHKDRRGVDLISDALPFGRLWHGKPDAISNAIGYAKFYSRSHNTVLVPIGYGHYSLMFILTLLRLP
jgi:hypothetical protein